MDTQEGARKRQRSAEDATESTPEADGTIQVDTEEEPILRDELYYRENGDCVILVGRVLFKIHRFLLERDGSAFLDMFSLSKEIGSGDQPNTDENPLVLYDEVDDFRALCWIIYALPKVYMQQFASTSPDIGKLVSLYLIAHKYHFESHESFAQHLLHQYCTTNSKMTAPNPTPLPAQGYFTTCPESRIRSVLQIASLTEQPRPNGPGLSFSSALQQVWLKRLQQTGESIRHALEAAEALGLRSYLGELYYLGLTRMKPMLIEGSSAYTFQSHDDLTVHQRLILYHGYWSLRNYWVKLREDGPRTAFPDAGFDTQWKQAWERSKHRELARNVFDPWLDMMMMKWDISNDRNVNLRAGPTMGCINRLINELTTNKATHFLGPVPVPGAEMANP